MKLSKRKLFSAALSLAVLLTISYGALVTVHATTPHNCPRAVLPNGRFVAHDCFHDPNKNTMDPPYPVHANHKLVAMDDPTDPEYDPSMVDFNSPCSCPWWCFFGGGGVGGTGYPSGTGGLNWDDVFSKRGFSKITAHGLFYRGK